MKECLVGFTDSDGDAVTLPRTRAVHTTRPTRASKPRLGSPFLLVMREPLFWPLLAMALLVLAHSAQGIIWPVSRDEGAFLTIAQEVLEGRIPYRDAFDHKSPGIYYLLAAVMRVLGFLSPFGQIVALRVITVLCNLGTAWGLVCLGRRWWRLEIGILAAALWLLAVPLYEGDFFLTEPFAVLATVWAAYLAARWTGARGALVAGALFGLATLFKQTSVLALPGLIL